MFDARSATSELLDDPEFDPRLAGECYRFMARVNRYAGGTRIVRRYIESIARERAGGVLRVLDIGSGICDIPIALSRWAATRGLRVEFTCLEPAGHASALARQRIAAACVPNVRLLQEDVLDHKPDEPYDCATASMCFHHFKDAEILAVLRRIRPFVHVGVLINDLRRTPAAWLAAALATLASQPAVRHDGRLSIRRGFRASELGQLLSQLDHCTVSVKPAAFFRIAAVIRHRAGPDVTRPTAGARGPQVQRR
jgi:2-polyprenyl-3-methyl-5-hydroxy-6-metoxy-1,4-benzoquinol methylase